VSGDGMEFDFKNVLGSIVAHKQFASCTLMYFLHKGVTPGLKTVRNFTFYMETISAQLETLSI